MGTPRLFLFLFECAWLRPPIPAVKELVRTSRGNPYRTGLVISRGDAETAADMLIGMFDASRQGEFGPTDPALARLPGRPRCPSRRC
jgi:hypothetical protein